MSLIRKIFLPGILCTGKLLHRIIHFNSSPFRPITFIFFLFFSVRGSGQVSDISFDHIFLEQGLSQSIVKCILQDYRGFMHFGTEDGLNIYDGYNFVIYRKTADQNSLVYNDISALCEDDYKQLWIGTFNSGVNLYIPEKKKFLLFNHVQQNPHSLSNDNINCIIKDQGGAIWIGTDDGLNRINQNNGNYVIERGLSVNNARILDTGIKITAILNDDSFLWVGTDNGLYKISRKKNSFSDYLFFRNNARDKYSITNSYIRTIYKDNRGNIWIGTDFGLNKIPSSEVSSPNQKFTRYVNSVSENSLNHNEVYALNEDESGNIWIGTNGGGLNIYNSQTGKFISYAHDPLDDRSLSANEIRSIFRDKSGIMWIGTYGSGINKVSRGNDQFYRYKHRQNDPNSLSHSIIWSFYEDKDSVLWIGTHSGLDRLDRKTNTYRIFLHRPGVNSLSNNIVRVITAGNNGRLLIGTNGGGIDEFDPATGIFKNWSNIPGNSNSLAHNEIRAIYKDRDGIIWIGTYGRGMDKFDPVNGKFTHHFNIPGDSTSISQNYVRVIVEDKNGYLWIGTEGGGLNKFDKRTGKFTRIRTMDGVQNLSPYIFSIYIDEGGTFWLGTYGGGLQKFNPETGSGKSYTTADGLPSNSVYGILRDGQGNFWISSTNGIAKFNPEKEKIKNFNVKDGLQNNEFNGGSYCLTRSGEMLFGGINGFNAFYPGKIKENNYMPPVVLTSFKVFNKEAVFERPLTSVNEIELSYDNNVFSFEFSALDYSAPEKNKYAYMMEGVDKEWVHVDADKRFASYTTLSPGKYKFHVKASNSDGFWNEEVLTIAVVIVPPFWQKAWFIIAAALLLIGIAYYFYLRRLRIMRIKIELKTAHDAQLSIMPRSDPRNDKLDISGTCIPANEVGGDFFDYFWLDDEKTKFGIIIGDVSGKAMKAAVTAIMSSGMILSEIKNNVCINRILENVNSTLLKKIEKNMFVSVCICVFDTRNRILSFANAGLNKPMLLSRGRLQVLQSSGPRLPLGIKEDVSYVQTDYPLSQGDLLVLTTDGINEAQNSSRELFGNERLEELVQNFTPEMPASEIKNSIISKVQKFSKLQKPNDDMTVIVVRVR